MRAGPRRRRTPLEFAGPTPYSGAGRSVARPGWRSGAPAWVAAALCLGGPAVAQQLPPAADPGRIERRLEPPPQREPAEPVPAPPSPRIPAPEAAERVRFVLRSLAVTDASAIPERELLAPYGHLIGREISLLAIFQAAEELTARYRRAGYVLSQVVVPAQEIRDGAVRLAAIEGFVASFAVTGAEGADRARIERRLEPLTRERPLRAETLERQLLLINDLPGVSARAVLAPSESTVGASDLLLNVERERLAGYATLDNRGSDLIGPEQAGIGLRFNSPLDFGERISLRAATASPARELRFGEAAVDLPVGAGAELSVRASRARIEPAGELSRLDVEGTSELAELALSYSVARARSENLTVRGRLTARRSSSDILDQPLSEDRLRVLSLEAEYDLVDAWRGVSLVAVELAQGLDALGASEAGDPLLSRANGRPDFTRFALTVARLQEVGAGFAILLEASGQYAFSQLLASEEFGVGGARFGRAYDPSEITGDHGVAAAVELRYGVDIGDPWLRSLQLYGSADFGTVWRIDDSLGERRESLASAAAGMRFNVLENVSGSLEVAVPLTATPAAADERSPRLFFTIVRRF